MASINQLKLLGKEKFIVNLHHYKKQCGLLVEDGLQNVVIQPYYLQILSLLCARAYECYGDSMYCRMCMLMCFKLGWGGWGLCFFWELAVKTNLPLGQYSPNLNLNIHLL